MEVNMGFTSKSVNIPVQEAVAVPAVATEADTVGNDIAAKRRRMTTGVQSTWTRYAGGDTTGTGVKTLLGS